MKYFLIFFLFCGNFILSQPSGAQKQQTYQMMLYYSPKCPYSRKVLAYLDNTGIKIPMKNVLAEAGASDELLAKGGHLIVPCLIVNGQPIYNATDIIDWLSAHQEELTKN
jgi:glutaredoxin 3